MVDQGGGGQVALMRQALLCVARCRKGNVALAGEALDAAAALQRQIGADMGLLAEAAVSLWWALGPAAQQSTRELASAAVDGLRRAARVRASERPGYYRLLGAVAWLEGARGDADEAWRGAVREGQRLGMTYEEAQSIDLLCQHGRLSTREIESFKNRARVLGRQLFETPTVQD